jgi:hypothetical protein
MYLSKKVSSLWSFFYAWLLQIKLPNLNLFNISVYEAQYVYGHNLIMVIWPFPNPYTHFCGCFYLPVLGAAKCWGGNFCQYSHRRSGEKMLLLFRMFFVFKEMVEQFHVHTAPPRDSVYYLVKQFKMYESLSSWPQWLMSLKYQYREGDRLFIGFKWQRSDKYALFPWGTVFNHAYKFSDHACELHEFRCGDGACIRRKSVCDGHVDCVGGLNEDECSK